MASNYFEGWCDRDVDVFLSYSHKNRKIGGYLKECLENFGLKVFLAHKDNKISDEWKVKILEKLRNCDVFVPLISTDFASSEWTDQEIGFALAHNKYIMPVKIEDLEPYGFIAKFHGGKLNSGSHADCYNISIEIIEAILKKRELMDRMMDRLIKSFINSKSYEDAGIKAELIVKYLESEVGISPKILSEIINGSLKNRQIYESYRAREKIKYLLNECRSSILKEDLSKVDELFGKFENAT
jgi:hypothetical protein